jgi:hypothetical protein
MTLAEVDAAIGKFIVEGYNHRTHGETRQPPQARWEAGGFLPRMPESPDQLDLLLLTVTKPLKLHPDGIHFQGLRYIDPVLAAYVGEDVIVRYDPRDLAEIRVFHRNRYLCRAICPDLAGGKDGSPSLIDEIVREGARRMLAEALQAEVDAYIAQFTAERDKDGRRLVVRNGEWTARRCCAITATATKPRGNTHLGDCPTSASQTRRRALPSF